MSTATMNWALRQELESCQQQILLYVIADSAMPDGVTRGNHCDSAYMCKRARMTRATMFRRLGEIERLGLLRRFKFYSDRGAPIYEIRLNLSALVKVPIKGRKDAEHSAEEQVDVDNEEEGDHLDEEGKEVPESHGETLPQSHAETLVATIVPPSAAPQSQSCDYISPSLPKEESPPYPPPGGALSREETKRSEQREALWQRFVQGYPGIARMDQQAARDELDKLSLDDAEWAASVLPALREELAKPKAPPPKGAHLWLRKGMFRNFPKGKLDAPPAEAVWIEDGSDEDRAFRLACGLTSALLPFVMTGKAGRRGYFRETAIGPDLLALLTVVDESPAGWQEVARGTPKWVAWQRRFRRWTKRERSSRLGSEGAIRVPWPWPPGKDGKLYLAEHLEDPEGEDFGT